MTVRNLVPFGIFFALLASGANAALLDFTVPTGGYTTQSYSAVAGTDPSAAINASGQITSNAGFNNITLDVVGEDLDIVISAQSGNPYFDSGSGGMPAGVGICQNLTAAAQCDLSGSDGPTVGIGEYLAFRFFADDGNAISVHLGQFVLRNADNELFNGSIFVHTQFGEGIGGLPGGFDISVVDGIADFSNAPSSSSGSLLVSEFLLFDGHATEEFYIASATITTIVPVPAALWLFASGLIGLRCIKRR